MNLVPSEFQYTFSNEQVVFLKAFFKTYIKKMSDGEWKDQMNNLYEDFCDKYRNYKIDNSEQIF